MRFPLKAGAALIGLVLLLPSAARASVDLTGSWSVVASTIVGPMSATFDFVQTGTQLDLTLRFESGSPQGPYTGAIDPDAGTFTVPLPDTVGIVVCTGNQISGTAAPDGQSIAGGWVAMFMSIHFFCQNGGGPFTGVRAHCGDGIINAGEVCDDGNVADGDCCAADCSTSEPDATTCDDGNACTTGDQCAAGDCRGGSTMYCAPCEACSPGGCIIPADDGCQPALAGGKSQIMIRDRSDDPTKDALVWSWKSSASVAVGDFGAPTMLTDYTLCVIDRTGGVPTLRMSRWAPGNASIGALSWKSGKKGFTYTRKDAIPAGLTKLTLGAGAVGHGKLAVKGTGTLLDVPAGGFTAPVTVRLVRHDAPICWEGTFSTPQTNDGAVFKAKSD